MDEYIDKVALIAQFERDAEFEPWDYSIDDAIRTVKSAPTADVVPVARCRDCKHWYSDADTGMACEFTNLGQPEDGFCNWAERRQDDDTHVS